MSKKLLLGKCFRSFTVILFSLAYADCSHGMVALSRGCSLKTFYYEPGAPPPLPLAERPSFDVVSIKVNKSGTDNMSLSSQGYTFRATNVSLVSLLTNASGIRDGLVFGLPSQLQSQRFDIDAKVISPEGGALGVPTREQRQIMLMQILSDRFHLRSHLEVKVLPIYNLLILKTGPKFRSTKVNLNEEPAHDRTVGPTTGMSVRNDELSASGVPMSSLVYQLSAQLDRTVIDKTGLTGKYDLHLKWAPEQAAAVGADNGLQGVGSGEPAPSIFTALQEQLGLKLEPSKGPVTVLKVDSIEMPSEN